MAVESEGDWALGDGQPKTAADAVMCRGWTGTMEGDCEHVVLRDGPLHLAHWGNEGVSDQGKGKYQVYQSHTSGS